MKNLFTVATALLLIVTLAACSTAPTKTKRPKAAAKPPVTAQYQLSAADKKSFEIFYKKLKADAAAAGHNAANLDAAFGGAPQPITSVIQAEKSQPELTRTFASYTGAMLTSDRVNKGLEHARSHEDALEKISDDTGVPVGVIVALWGIETNFGARQGENPIIPSLVTLAWKSPRGDYFRKEVMASLTVLERTGMQPAQLKGSWAGAMGQCQFMPSSYLAYAKDGDNDGQADIWTNEDDVFASTANYLKAKGWRAKQPWRLTLAKAPSLEGVNVNARGLSDPLPLREWKKRGAEVDRLADRSINKDTPFHAYQPEPNGPVSLLGPNFDVILKWNNSSYFAFSVLSLGDILESKR